MSAPTSTVDLDPPARVAIYYTIIIASGQVFLPISLATLLLFRRTVRHPVLMSFIASWILYSFSTTILLYSNHRDDLAPPVGICTAQVILMHGSILLCVFTALALVFHLYMALLGAQKPRTAFANALLVGVPPTLFLIYEFVLVVLVTINPEFVAVERGFDKQCQLASDRSATAHALSKFTPILVGLLVEVCLVFAVYMLYNTVQNVWDFRSWHLRAELAESRGKWFAMLIRFIVFCVYAFFTEIACFVDIFTPQGTSHNLVQVYTGTLPLAVFVVFGTASDIRQHWCFWRRRRSADSDVEGKNLMAHDQAQGA